MHNKVFNIAKNHRYDGNQRGLTSMVYKFFGINTFNTNRETGIYSENK